MTDAPKPDPSPTVEADHAEHLEGMASWLEEATEGVAGIYDELSKDKAALIAGANALRSLAHPAPVGDQEGFAWVLMRNIQPHTVFLVEADAIAERDRKRASEMEWRAQNAHVADVRTYWNVDKTPLAQANPPVRSGDQERIAEWQPIETAPKDRGPIVVAFSPEDWTTAEAVWRDGEWRAACWFTHRASNYFESREHVVKPVYWQPKPVRSTPSDAQSVRPDGGEG